MNEYLNIAIFMLLGFIGALAHYLKKRHWDNTTTVSLWPYVTMERKATYNAVKAIVVGEYTYAVSGISIWPISLHDLIGILTVGYLADSWFNKAPVAPSCGADDSRISDPPTKEPV
jgi:hypothetical protein